MVPAVAVMAVILMAASAGSAGSWTALTPAPVPPPAAGGEAHFRTVSCPTSTFCLAMGNTQVPWDIAQVWNGTTWAPFDFAPRGEFGSEIYQVECATPTSCFVAYDRYDDFDLRDLIARWDGSTWSYVPGGTDGSNSVLGCAPDGYCMLLNARVTNVWTGSAYEEVFEPPISYNAVTCVAAGDCTAVGYGAASHWDGTSWSDPVTLPAPAGEHFNAKSVSCVASGCVTVGYSSTDDVTTKPAAARWNGTAWVATAVPLKGLGSLESVDCSRSTRCLAVGTSSGGVSSAVTWDGSRWAIAKQPPGQNKAVYPAVSCAPAATSCVAVGWNPNTTPDTLRAARFSWLR